MEFHHIKWMDIIKPTESELKLISEKISMNLKDLEFAADPKQSLRLEDLENHTGLVVNMPLIKHKFDKKK